MTVSYITAEQWQKAYDFFNEKTFLTHVDVCNKAIEIALAEQSQEPHTELKANLVKLDGKLMTREAAIAEWVSKKDMCDVWFKNMFNHFVCINNDDPQLIFNHSTQSEYELRERPLKQISWKHVPVGVKILYKPRNSTHYLRRVSTGKVWLEELYETPGIDGRLFSEVELAPADQQDWMVRHGTNPVDIFAVKGIVVQSKYVNGDMFVFKVTGIAEGYELK